MGSKLRWQSCSKSDFPLKRSKVAKACQGCRTKKMRCDGKKPCTRCEADRKHCVYRPTSPSFSRKSKSSPSPLLFEWSRLDKLAFHQDLYIALNLSSPISRTNSKKDRLPALLFEFYHLTSHPITIWTRFYTLFQKWYRLQKSSSLKDARVPADIAKEALRLFLRYNSLYTLFIDATDLLLVLDQHSFFPTTGSSTPLNNTSTYSIDVTLLLLDTILALTFLAAGQTLGSDLLLDIAHSFYDTVHKRWLTMTFLSTPSTRSHSYHTSSSSSLSTPISASPLSTSLTSVLIPTTSADLPTSSSESPSTSAIATLSPIPTPTPTPTADSLQLHDSRPLDVLAQASILLIHFQCTAICEQQAYMTSRIAQGYVERLISQTENKDGISESENHITLQYTLHAWQVWFAVYLYGHQSLISPMVASSSSFPMPPPFPTLVPSLSQEEQQIQQQVWTWSVLTQYIPFLESLLKSNRSPQITVQELMEKCQSLSSLSTIHNSSNNNNKMATSQITSSEQLVALYCTMLIIQLFSSQWLPRLDFFTPAIQRKKEKQENGHENGDDDDKHDSIITGAEDNDDDKINNKNLSKNVCIQTSQRIIQMITTMMMTGQDITTHHSSSPSLLPVRYRALCLAATILVPLGQYSSKSTTSLNQSLQQLNHILKKDIQTWSVARQCLYHLQQRLPTVFANQNDDDYNEEGISGTHNNISQHGQSQLLTQQRRNSTMMKRGYMDQEQLNKLSTSIGKRKWEEQQHTISSFEEQSNGIKKRHRTHPTLDGWLPMDPIYENSSGGPGPFLELTQSPTPLPLSSSIYPAMTELIPSQSIITPMPTMYSIANDDHVDNNDDKNDSTSFHMIQSTPIMSPLTYHHQQPLAQQKQQQHQAGSTTTTTMVSSPLITNSSSGLPSYQSTFNNYKRGISSSYVSTRQSIHDTFTASMMETLHTPLDQSSIHTNMEASNTSTATTFLVDEPIPSKTNAKMMMTIPGNNYLLSDDKQTEEEWMYFLYQQQQQPSSSDPFILFSSSIEKKD
ncbi:uncharacterized protein BX664DRAFT_321252 [Halteromyces radiatus]|uniref:uncharacterized protein n=1 Tax=Halteromyces radiatus TaxID=101107 RepID=UPI00221F39DA|nr:uncharacterized protein BX664DRAFT_321252 [Halteromyces radiatus]KAI8099439.1 hypothetical protein BX664DRAFT_321252 [Halteromyces radiatus]